MKEMENLKKKLQIFVGIKPRNMKDTENISENKIIIIIYYYYYYCLVFIPSRPHVPHRHWSHLGLHRAVFHEVHAPGRARYKDHGGTGWAHKVLQMQLLIINN